MKYKPGDMRLRVELLRPRNTKTATGNTKGEYTSYGTRYAAIVRAGGSDALYNDQDIATRLTTWVIRFDALVKASWVVRYGSQDYFVESAPSDPDNGAKRYLELNTVAIDGVTLVS